MRSLALHRVVRFGLQNYWRNGWLSLATTLMLALTLFIVSVFILQTYVIQLETQALREKLDMAVYIDDAAKEEEIATFITTLKANSNVKEAIYLNKQQVIDQWNNSQANQKIRDLVSPENNPLPRTVKIKANDPSELESIANQVTKDPLASHIRKVSYQDNRDVIQQLVAKSRKTIRNGIIVSSIFIVIVILFVYNTIRLVIQFREEEIAVMKLVGATDAFIRGPFIVEGALYGIIAGVATLPALFYFLKNGLQESNNLVSSTDVLITNRLMAIFQDHFILIAFILISLGVILAAICSSLSVHRHLKG